MLVWKDHVELDLCYGATLGLFDLEADWGTIREGVGSLGGGVGKWWSGGVEKRRWKGVLNLRENDTMEMYRRV